MINYTLKIYKIELIYVSESMPDYVKYITGTLTGEENGISFYQEIISTVATVDVVNYIPYEQLTEQEALNIFYESIDPDYYNLVKSQIASTIASVYTPYQMPYTKPLPWL